MNASQEWASRHPDISFTHTFPGFVSTPMVTKWHWTVPYILPLFKYWTVTPETCAQFMWSPLLSNDAKFKTGAHRMDQNANPVQPNKSLTPEVIKAVWDHISSMTASK